MDRVKVVLEDRNARLPTRGHDTDLGFDLYTSVQTSVAVNQYQLIPCGIRIEMPENYGYIILGRSSTMAQRRLMVIPSVIDPDYRGLIYVGVYNLGTERVWVEVGDRLGQAVPWPLFAAGWNAIPTHELSDTERGEGGFGSTGQ